MTDRHNSDEPQKPHTTLSDIAKAHSFKDLRNVLSTEPCAREGLLYGIGVGATVAVLRVFKGRSFVNAGNWGFLSFALVAVAAKKLCHFQYAHQSAKLNTLFEMQSKNSPNVKGFQHSAPPKDNDAE
ncbi:hypothetical protein IWW39_002444 [Coemansia spiralis]|uniref:Cytochrome c oxidase assembly protein COX20, mitochondrial n=2 Tax=Coemansia TaxID=4863 RepID=A0A9W8L4G9_9FUNG|nr:hypothetical protein IWW39_002444 [Coemansia spiralis]